VRPGLVANPLADHMPKALSLFEKGPSALVAGRDLNPRPLGYEPYDVRLWRLGPSLAGVVTSADRPGPVSHGRLRLPRLVLSRRVWFTNRFTEQAIDLQFPHPSRPSAAAILSGSARRIGAVLRVPQQDRRVASDDLHVLRQPRRGRQCYAVRKCRIRLLMSVGRSTIRKCPTPSISSDCDPGPQCRGTLSTCSWVMPWQPS
jgi:hypothetical protein